MSLDRYDWASTPLGVSAQWPPELRIPARLVTGSGLPMALAWGPALTVICNDPFRALFDDGRAVDGQPLKAVLRESWGSGGAMVRDALAGATVAARDMRLVVERGRKRECGMGGATFSWSPLHAADGAVGGVVGTVIETIADAAGQRERAEIEARFETLAEAIEDVFYLSDLHTGELLYLNAAYERIWRRPRTALLADPSLLVETIHPEDRPVYAAHKAAQGRGEAATSVYRIRRPDGEERTIHDRCFPVTTADGGLRTAGVAVDITDARMVEDALRRRDADLNVMLDELRHRVRNILSVVRSIFARTVEASAGDIDALASHFPGRLDSLARSQTILGKDAARTADLQDMIRDEMLSVGATDGATLRIEGPDVTLPEPAVELMGLAIHELTTNALKFGALASKAATLSVEWSVGRRADGARWLEMRWIEDRVPAVSVDPRRHGFGRELIEETLPYRLGAETAMAFRGGGLRCTIALPLGEGAARASDALRTDVS